MTLAVSQGAVADRARRLFAVFSRAARAFRIYNANNSTLLRMIDDLDRAFAEVLQVSPDFSLTVRADAFLYGEIVVLEETNPDESIPFAFYRDGVRRLDFRSGLDRDEVEAFLQATALGLSFSGIGDDIVALLWRLDLEHVHYLVVDTTVVSAGEGGAPGAGAIGDAQLNAILHNLYGGTGGDDAPLSVHLDDADAPAKVIAEALDSVDEMAPGLHPARGYHLQPAYGGEILEEVAEEGEDGVAIRGLVGALRAFGEPLRPEDVQVLSDSLLRMFDTAVLENRYAVASRVVLGVRNAQQPRHVVNRWMEEVVSEARFRHIAAILKESKEDDLRAQMLELFRACGAWAVLPLLSLIPSLTQAQRRREVSDLIIDLGIVDFDPIRELLGNEQQFVAQEAIYLLARTAAQGGLALIHEVKNHPSPGIRGAIVENVHLLPRDEAREVVAEFMRDTDQKVRIAAIRSLVRIQGKASEVLIDSIAQRGNLENTSAELKRAVLETYGQILETRALPLLTRYIREGDGFLAPRESEELAVASMWALAQVRTMKAVEVLKKACGSRTRRLKETARDALLFMKEGT